MVAFCANLKHPPADESKWHVPLAPGVGQNSKNYWSLQMNDSKNSSKGLLVLKSEFSLNLEQIEDLTRQIEPLAAQLGLEPVVVPYGFDVEVKTGNEALLERVCAALEALVLQGIPPSVSSQEDAPQALNARPSGLNSRPTPEHGDRSTPAKPFLKVPHG